MSRPDEVFCLSCGPGTILDADPGAHRLRCPRCGTGSWLPALPLFIVTGASGTGITENQRFGAWLRARVTPSFDTSTASPAEVAGRIAAWVTALFPGTQSPGPL